MDSVYSKLAAEARDLADLVDAAADKGTKAANLRARKATLAVAKLGKEFRAATLEADKQ